jgi:hydrogenase maturation protease
MKNTLVLGLGNILLSDEGLGVRVIERLEERYHFSGERGLRAGGTLPAGPS